MLQTKQVGRSTRLQLVSMTQPDSDNPQHVELLTGAASFGFAAFVLITSTTVAWYSASTLMTHLSQSSSWELLSYLVQP